MNETPNKTSNETQNETTPNDSLNAPPDAPTNTPPNSSTHKVLSNIPPNPPHETLPSTPSEAPSNTQLNRSFKIPDEAPPSNPSHKTSSNPSPDAPNKTSSNPFVMLTVVFIVGNISFIAALFSGAALLAGFLIIPIIAIFTIIYIIALFVVAIKRAVEKNSKKHGTANSPEQDPGGFTPAPETSEIGLEHIFLFWGGIFAVIFSFVNANHLYETENTIFLALKIIIIFLPLLSLILIIISKIKKNKIARILSWIAFIGILFLSIPYHWLNLMTSINPYLTREIEAVTLCSTFEMDTGKYLLCHYKENGETPFEFDRDAVNQGIHLGTVNEIYFNQSPIYQSGVYTLVNNTKCGKPDENYVSIFFSGTRAGVSESKCLYIEK